MIHSDQHSDRPAFREIMEGMAEYYDKPKLSNRVLLMYFEALVSFDIDQVSNAANKHVQDPDKYNTFPKIADFQRLLVGGDIKPEEIISAAKLKRSPMGILARIHIGTWDLDNLSSFDLRQRAIECQELLPEWKERAVTGEYSEHELTIMIKHGVDPLAPFATGIAGPANQLALSSRIEQVTGSARHKFMLGNDQKPAEQKTNPEQVEKIRQEIRKTFIKPKLDKPKPDMSEPDYGN